MADPNAGYSPYPPQQAGYQPPPYQPPTGYEPAPQPAKHSSHHATTVVVTQQPTTTTTVYTRRYGTGDHGLVYAIIASCVVFWCAGWIGLCCTIPAIFFALNAQQEESAGNLEAMKQHHNWSVILSTVGLVTGFGCLFLWIILSVVG